MTPVASLLLGALLGAANAVSALGVARWTTRMEAAPAIKLFLGAMGLRMLLTLAAVAAVVAFVPVHRGAFVAGLGVLVAAGLAVEVFFVLGRTSSGTLQPTPPGGAADA